MINRRMGNDIGGASGNFKSTRTGGLLLCAVFGALCLAPTPATADFITFDLNAAILQYVPTNGTAGTLTVTENTGSNFQVRREDGAGFMDSTQISGSNFDFNFTLDLARIAGLDWSASGTMGFTDATGSTVVEAAFVADDVTILPYGTGILRIVGTLSSKSPATSILIGDPWIFLGDGGIDGEADGDAQISIGNPGAFDEGAVFVLKVGVGSNSLGSLFGTGFTKYGGEVKGMITPEPATMSLLALGGMMVLARRKRRHAA